MRTQHSLASRWFWPTLVGTCVLAMMCAMGGPLLRDPDTYWHIAAGRWMLAHHQVLHADPFSFSMRGTPWTAHEWLSEILFALVFDAFGWAGIIAFTALAGALAAAILTDFLQRYLEPQHVLMAVLVATMLATPHLLVRPHVLAMPCLVSWMAGLVSARERDTRPSYWLLLLMPIWANLHGGFTLGLALAVFFAAEAVWQAKLRGPVARDWAWFVVLAIACSLLSPNGLQGILFTRHILSQSYMIQVGGEWQSPNFHDYQPLEVGLLLALAGVLYKGIRLPMTRVLLMLGLLHLAFKYARSVELVGLLVPLAIVPALAPQLYANKAKASATAGTRPVHIIALLVAVLLVPVGLCWGTTHLDRDKFHITPDRALQAAHAAGVSGHVLNSWNFGGYVIFAGEAPFIDGRADMYGDAFIRPYIEAWSGDPQALASLLQRYDIRWTLLEPDSNASKLLDTCPAWRRVYADKIAVVHMRVPGVAPCWTTPAAH